MNRKLLFAFCLCLAATCSAAHATTSPSLSLSQTIGNWLACAFGSTSCVAPDTATNPSIKNN